MLNAYRLRRTLLLLVLPLTVQLAPACAKSDADDDAAGAGGESGSPDRGGASGKSGGGTAGGAARSGSGGAGGGAAGGKAGNGASGRGGGASGGRAGRTSGGSSGTGDSGAGGEPAPEGGMGGQDVGPGGGGASDGCPAGHFGPACEPCACDHGACSEGRAGSGLCTCELGWLGDACDRYPVSCKALAAAFPDADSGSYLIDPDGAGNLDPFAAFCDMSFDGGGWTLIMATNLLGPDDQAEGLVAEGSGTHMPPARVQALAATAISSQIHIRTRDAADTASITSTEDSLPIQNLRALHIVNDTSGIYSSTASVTDWTGPYATAPHLWHTCGPAPYEGVPGYPNIWWSCNNGNGLHVASTASGWSSEPSEALDMEVYVR